MKKFITTLQNIWKIEELRKRLIFTIIMIAVFRFGAHVLLPGVNKAALELAAGGGNTADIFGLLNAFTGGAFSRASVLALGIMPYITASIIIQLLGFGVPYFQRLQQKEGESGRKKLTQITRALTIAVTVVQGSAYLTFIKSAGAIDPNLSESIFFGANIVILSTGTIFAMWLGERITDKGVGNGISLLIMIGIIAALPGAFFAELQKQAGAPLIFILELAFFFAIIMASVLIIQAVRRIPLQYAKRMVGRGTGQMPASNVRDYLPVKVNAAGVMPIIFAQALMFLPAQIAQFSGVDAATSSGFVRALSNPFSLPSSIIAFFLVVVFTFFYTALTVNPKQHAEFLKRQNAFIPGIKPGKSTADFIDTITSRVTLPGSIFLGLITILPAVAVFFGVNQAFALFFGGTSLLILVGVALDTMQQINSYLIMRKYDGLIKSGKMMGRTGMQVGNTL